MSRGAATATGGGRKLGYHMSWLWRALCAARDLYVNTLMGCAGSLPADAAFGYPITFAASSSFTTSSAASSRRFSAADADEDLKELVRAASQRQQQRRHPAAVPRSRSVAAAVAMARIDEDGPCDFAASAAAAAVPRSRSCAAPGSGRAAGRRGRVAALAA